MKSVRSWLLSIGTVCAMLASPPAFAQVCTASSSGIAFGSFSPIVGATPASGQIAISCTGLLAFVKICVSVGPGTGQTSYAPRIATNGAVPMNYNLYTDSAGSTILGSRAAAASYAPGSVNVSVLLGTYSQNFTVYGKIQGTQTGLTAGTYTANFADAVITYKTYALLDPVPDCATLAAPFASFQFPVTATVINDCTIASTNIDFGTTGLLTSTLAASGTLSVTCTNAAPYSIALSAGTGGRRDARRPAHDPQRRHRPGEVRPLRDRCLWHAVGRRHGGQHRGEQYRHWNAATIDRLCTRFAANHAEHGFLPRFGHCDNHVLR